MRKDNQRNRGRDEADQLKREIAFHGWVLLTGGTGLAAGIVYLGLDADPGFGVLLADCGAAGLWPALKRSYFFSSNFAWAVGFAFASLFWLLFFQKAGILEALLSSAIFVFAAFSLSFAGWQKSLPALDSRAQSTSCGSPVGSNPIDRKFDE